MGKKTIKHISILILTIIAIVILFIFVKNSYKNATTKEYTNINYHSNRFRISFYDEANEFGILSSNTLAEKIPILTYHKIVSRQDKLDYYSDNIYVVDVQTVHAQLEYLYKHGWRTIDLDMFYRWYNHDIELPQKTFIITVDDGDIELYYNLLPLLKKYNFKAVSFVVGINTPMVSTKPVPGSYIYIGYDLIAELTEQNSLIEFQSHSYNWHYNKNGRRIIHQQSEAQLMEDIEKQEQLFKEISMEFLAYPFGNYNNRALKVIKESNIKMAFVYASNTYATRSDDVYLVNRLKVLSTTSWETFVNIFDYAK